MEHEKDEFGEDIHIDVDQEIPTGICAICSWEPEDEHLQARQDRQVADPPGDINP